MAEDGHSPERRSRAAHPGGIRGNPGLSLQARNPREAAARKLHHPGKIGCTSITLYKLGKQSPAPRRAVRDGVWDVPGILSPMAPICAGLKGAGEAGDSVRIPVIPVPRVSSGPRVPPGQLRPLLSASRAALSRAFA